MAKNKVEILCATMNQMDFSKFREMNIQSDVVFANQSDRYEFEETNIDGHHAKMISTSQRGVGKNRNTAMLYATGEICLFSDDDVCYANGYTEKVIKAFKEVPDADILIFNLVTKSSRKQKQNNRVKRCRIWNVLSYGTYRIAFKLDKVQKANIWFTQLFGGGSKYPSGEDSLWLIDALRKNLKVYTYPLVIGEVKQEDSTWFKGFDEEYFFGRGAWVQSALPELKYFMVIYYVIRFRKLSNVPSSKIVKRLLEGIKAYKSSKSYSEKDNLR